MPVEKRGIHWFLTDEEVHQVRDALGDLRQSGRYDSGRSFVSGLSFRPEVMSLSLPETYPQRVTIRDITLRTAQQVAGIAMSREDRRRLIKALIDIGIRSIQVGSSGWGRKENLDVLKEDIQYIKELNPDVETTVGGIDSLEGIDRFVDIGLDLMSMAVPSAIAISPFYVGSVDRLAWEQEDWRAKRDTNNTRGFQDALDNLKRLVDHAHSRGVPIQTNLSMLLYATPEIIDQFTREMAAVGADIISFADGPSAMTPNAIAYAVQIAKQNASDAKIGIHLHNTFGLGVALNLAAAQAGADIFEVAVNGYCSGPGQADEQQVIAALELLCGIDTGIDLSGLTDLRRLGEDITRIHVGRSHPITGEEAFNWGGADGITLELDVDPLIHLCLKPEIVGNKFSNSIEGAVVDRSSGMWTVTKKLTELGFKPEKEEVEKIHAALQDELLIRKRSLTNEEIRAIALKVVPTLTGNTLTTSSQ